MRMKKTHIIVLLLLALVGTAVATNYKTLFELDDENTIGLCSKDTTTWECTDQVKGNVVYKIVGEKLKLRVFAKGVDCDKEYQLTLNGDGSNTDNADDKLGNNCANPNSPAVGYEPAWECGKWGTEGFWNFEMSIEPEEKQTKQECKYEKVKICRNVTRKKCHYETQEVCRTRRGREYCYNKRIRVCEPVTEEKCYYRRKKVCTPGEPICFIKADYELDLPIGVYKGIKFIVKESLSPWTPVAMETSAMNFAIV